ncbi:MAG: CoA-binding protein [Candidatus Berkiellales bacterium]
MMTSDINQFLSASAFAVAGASNDRNKYGNKVLRCYLQHGKKVYPVNPREQFIEGIAAIQNIADLPAEVSSLSVITPPAVTEKIIEQAIKKGIKNIWLQPGAESDQAIEIAQKHGVNIIAGGPCILVTLGFKDN